MKPYISLVTLGVRDLAKATAFYRALGWETHGDFDGASFFQLRGAWLSLYPRDDLARDAQVDNNGEGFRAFTLAHNVASKAEVDAVLLHAQSVGATIQKTAREADWGGYSGYFADLDGFLWEVAWNPHLDLTTPQ